MVAPIGSLAPIDLTTCLLRDASQRDLGEIGCRSTSCFAQDDAATGDGDIERAAAVRDLHAAHHADVEGGLEHTRDLEAHRHTAARKRQHDRWRGAELDLRKHGSGQHSPRIPSVSKEWLHAILGAG